ncbi:MAG: hypothetical protein Q7R88_01585 [bacterium]|nr:hypothetical protein [bacterium]
MIFERPRPIVEAAEQPKSVNELLDTWLSKQTVAESIYGKLGTERNVPQEHYQVLQSNLEQRQNEALAAFDQLAKQPGPALAAIAERRKNLGAAYETGVRRNTGVEGTAGQEFLTKNLDLLDKLEEKLRTLG